MKIKITKVDTINGDGSISLEQCGFKIGDVVEIDGHFSNGDFCVLAIRNTEYIQIGDNVSVTTEECEVVEE